MENKLKRFLSLTLALVLVMSCVPAAVFAEGTEGQIERCGHNNYGEPVVTEATCGAAGTKVYTCQEDGCEDSYEESIPATGNHVYENGKCACGAADPDGIQTTGETEPGNGEQEVVKTPPKATVSVLDPLTLAPDSYMVWPSGSDDVARPLQAVMNFKALETVEEARPNGYLDWKCDFYLSFEGLPAEGLKAEDCYLAGNYGDFGWIVIPTDELTVEGGVEYPVVSGYDANITYKQICESVKDFTAALYVAPKILRANPDFKVNLTLKMKNPNNDNDVITIGETATYDAEDLMPAAPKAEVTVKEPQILTVAETKHHLWDGSLKEDTVDRPLQAVMNFKALETVEEARPNGYLDWKCDFYLRFEGLPAEGLKAEDCYLAGNYGDFGWIVIPTDELTVGNSVEYPVVSGYDANITYKQICESVKDFTAALYVAPRILSENPDFKVTLSLKMTNPNDAEDILTVGKPAVYTAEQLLRSFPPKAEVSVLDPLTLAADSYMVWPSGDKDVARPLQAVMNFKALDTAEEAAVGGYGDWICDFYLTFRGLPENGLAAKDCYLAGNYGSFGWVVVPTDSLTVKNGEEYYVVGNYDAKLTYNEICENVKNFTAALYVAPEILAANPEFEVDLKLKMKNPDKADDIITIGKTATFDAEELLEASGIVAQNTTTGKLYSTVNAASTEAVDKNETIILLTDTNETAVSVYSGVTLDLNGHELTTEYMTSYGNIVDNSSDKSGLLKVSGEKFMIQKSNMQLPIKNGQGYKFVSMEEPAFNHRIQNELSRYAFQTLFDKTGRALMANGSKVSGVTINVRVSWSQKEGTRSQNFVYNDDLVDQVMESYDATTGKYGKMFTLQLKNMSAYKDLTFTAVVCSDTGVEFTVTDKVV